METRDPLRQFVVFSEGIPVYQAGGGTYGFSHFAIGVLVTVQMDESIRLGTPRQLKSVGCRNILPGPMEGCAHRGANTQGSKEVSRDLIMRISINSL